jgi:predicted transcriptional regulator
MNIKTLKSEIYQKLDELDEQGLSEVNDMVTAYLKQTDEEAEWDALPDEDKAAIDEGLEQAEKGMTVPYDEVRERIHKKLSQYGLSD